MHNSSNRHRLEYLDWVRGLAAAIMLQGHVFDSFLKNDLRGGGAFIYSQFVGGMPPAIFLFLTGVTLAFLMDSVQRKGLESADRIRKSLRRAGYLIAIAAAFRIQMFVTGQPAPWSDLLKVDVLNGMGFAIAIMSPMALFRTSERVRHCAVLGLAIAFASPVISQLDWSGVPAPLRAYIVPDYRYFSFFPWASYLAFGVSAGSLLRTVPAESTERVMQWTALLAGALIGASWYFSNLPFSIYSKSEYWLNSPALILTKLGVTLLLLAFAFVWTRSAAGGWSWVRQLGTTSLLVYWVHIELIYGRWLAFWKGALTVGQTVAASAALILLMVMISAARSNWDRISGWASELRWRLVPRPDTAGGD